MKLQDVKIIDLRASVLDREKSDPECGRYVFKEKRYVDYKGKSTRPNYKFLWCRWEPKNNYREFNEWNVRWGDTLLTNAVDPYIPEGIPKDAEGHFRYGDVILVKRPLINELKRLEENEKISKRGAGAKMQGFQNEMKLQGVDISDDQFAELTGQDK